MNNETPEDKLKVAFRIIDLNGNGKISFCEMTNIIEDIFRILHADTTMKNAVIESTKIIFLKRDKNEDEYVTEEEFVASCLQDDLLWKNMLIQSRFLENIAIKNNRAFQRSLETRPLQC